MGCAIIAVLTGMPRLALVALWILRDGYLAQAYDGPAVPVLGFFFAPLTTLAYAFAVNSLGAPGEINALGWFLIGLAFMADVGMLGGAERQRRRR